VAKDKIAGGQEISLTGIGVHPKVSMCQREISAEKGVAQLLVSPGKPCDWQTVLRGPGMFPPV